MELRQLRYFVKVAETLNFSEAAKALFVTQSTLSQQIKQLEDSLDTQLLLRSSHSVTLTESGAELLPHARQTLLDADLCEQRIRDLDRGLGGTLNIGVTYSFSPILTESLFTFMKEYPKVKLNILYKPMSELMELLVARELDFVLAFKPTEHIPGVESHYLSKTISQLSWRRIIPLPPSRECRLKLYAAMISLSLLRDCKPGMPLTI